MMLVVATAGLLAALTLQPCVIKSSGQVARAQCGDITVDVDDNTAGSIRIGFALLPAKADTKLADPVVFLAGGPGQAASELLPAIAPTFATLQSKRDVVFFDARGTGRSTAYACPDARTLAQRKAAPQFEQGALVRSCVDRLPFAPTLLTTKHIARDLEAVRVALGASQLNLVGGSYGTRVALAYDAMFPGHVRTMVLDGVVPAEMVVGNGAEVDAERALALLAERCARTPACQNDDFDVMRAARSLVRTPMTAVLVRHPRTGLATTISIDGDDIAGLMRVYLYAEETTALLVPLLRAGAAGDFTSWAAQMLMADASEQINTAMHLSVVCAEDAPWFDVEAVATDSGVFSNLRAQYRASCALWPHATVPRALPATSNTPTLLLSGTNDPVTPPAYAQRARAFLPNSVHVVAEGFGHGIFMRGCVPDVLTKFIQTGSASTLDVSCTGTMQPFPLFIDAAGPAP